MKKSGRYKTAHLIEDQYEPGSNNQVLKNKLGITIPNEMDRQEKEEQLRAMDELTDLSTETIASLPPTSARCTKYGLEISTNGHVSIGR